MPSEHRLHPISILFNLAAQAKELLIPGLVVLLTARGSDTWQVWLMVLLIPYTLVAIGRYVSFRYRYEPHELVVRSGLVFRNERHIPYARIQNLDAVQNLLHRAAGVVKVRLETGGGQEPEATMSVLPVAAFDEMRRRVFAERHEIGLPEAGAPASAEVPAAETLLQLSPRELFAAGLIENRGMVLIAAAFGVAWELGALDTVVERLVGEQASSRGAIRGLVATLVGRGTTSWRQIALMAIAFLGVLVGIRLLSMVWGFVRLHGFRLTRIGEDLRSEFGLFTRVTATVPMRRIQTLTVFQGPWHQLFGWAAVRVTTAGGHGTGGQTVQREWLAPILRRDAVPDLLRRVLPEVQVDIAQWQGVHPRAIVRARRVSIALALIVSAALAGVLGWWDLAAIAVLVTWAAVSARQYVRYLKWGLTENAVLFGSGWLRRYMTIARFTRIQAVTLQESPFDRRTGMASVRVDTAGGDTAHAVDIPYLSREVADTLFDRLSAQAARTEFRW